MRINVSYTVTKTIDLEVSDEFKALNDNELTVNTDEWVRLALGLEGTILQMIPESDANILAVTNTETNEIIYGS